MNDRISLLTRAAHAADAAWQAELNRLNVDRYGGRRAHGEEGSILYALWRAKLDADRAVSDAMRFRR